MRDRTTALRMYKTHVLPVLQFGIYMLENYHKGEVSRLQKLQNRCLRLCFRIKRADTHAYPIAPQGKSTASTPPELTLSTKSYTEEITKSRWHFPGGRKK